MVAEAFELGQVEGAGVGEAGGFGAVAAVAVGGVDCEGGLRGQSGEQIQCGVAVAVEVGCGGGMVEGCGAAGG